MQYTVVDRENKNITWVHKSPDVYSHASRLALTEHFKDSQVSVVDGSRDVDVCKSGVVDSSLFDRLVVEWAKGGEDKQSASASVVISAILKAAGNPRVFIKLSFGTNRDALYYERLLYCHVTQKLLRYQITPCVVPFLGYVRVENRLNKCEEQQQSSSSSSLSPAQRPPAQVCNAIKAMSAKEMSRGRSSLSAEKLSHGHALITEMSEGGVSLKEWMRRTHSVDDWREVWFQVVYTLQCFAEIRFTHWDLHYGNVFVEDTGSRVSSLYMVANNRFYTLTSRWLVKIYDFDRSCKLEAPDAPPGLRNAITNYAMQTPFWKEVYGGQNTWDSRVDYMRLTQTVLSRSRKMPEEFATTLERTVSMSRLADADKQLSFTGTLCFVSAAGNSCTIDPIRSRQYGWNPFDYFVRISNSNLTSDMLIGSPVSGAKARQFYREFIRTPYRVFALPSMLNKRDLFVENAETAVSTLSTFTTVVPATPATSATPVRRRRRSRSRSRSRRRSASSKSSF
jgi:hypothetical protein